MNLSQTTTREYFAGYLKEYFLEKRVWEKTLTNKKASRSEKTSGSLFMYLKSRQRAAEAQKCPTALIFLSGFPKSPQLPRFSHIDCPNTKKLI